MEDCIKTFTDWTQVLIQKEQEQRLNDLNKVYEKNEFLDQFFRKQFLKINKTWLKENLSQVFSPKTLKKDRDSIIANFEKVIGSQTQNKNQNEEDEDGDQENQVKIQVINPMKNVKQMNARTKQMLIYWVKRARNLQKIQSLVAGIVEQATQRQCHYCNLSWGLKAVAAPQTEFQKYNNTIEDIYFKFQKETGIKVLNSYKEIDKWQMCFKQNCKLITMCMLCLDESLNEYILNSENTKKGMIMDEFIIENQQNQEEPPQEEIKVSPRNTVPALFNINTILIPGIRREETIHLDIENNIINEESDVDSDHEQSILISQNKADSISKISEKSNDQKSEQNKQNETSKDFLFVKSSKQQSKQTSIRSSNNSEKINKSDKELLLDSKSNQEENKEEINENGSDRQVSEQSLLRQNSQSKSQSIQRQNTHVIQNKSSFLPIHQQNSIIQKESDTKLVSNVVQPNNFEGNGNENMNLNMIKRRQTKNVTPSEFGKSL